MMITRVFGGMALPAPFFALLADSPEKALAWIGYGIVFALLSIATAIAAIKE